MTIKNQIKKILFLYILICISVYYILTEKVNATSCTDLAVRYYILCKDSHCYEGFQVNEIRTGRICGRRPVVEDLPLWVKGLSSDLLKSTDNVSSSGIFQIQMMRHYYEEELFNRKALPQSYDDFIRRTIAKISKRECDNLPDSITRYKVNDMRKELINTVFLHDASILYQNYYGRPIIKKILGNASEKHIKSQKSIWINNEIKALNSLRLYKFKNRGSFFLALILICISVSIFRKNITGNKTKQIRKPKNAYPVLLQMILFIISIKLAFTSLFSDWLFIFIWPIIAIVWVYEFLLYVLFVFKRKYYA